MTDELRTAKRLLLGVLWLAGVVSVAANVVSAEPTVIGRAVASWPPIALLLVVEVLARVPIPTAGVGRWLVVLGAGSVALVAGVISFSHLYDVAEKAGESEFVAWLFPLSVDGLAVVASVALVEVNRRIQLDDSAEPLPAAGVLEVDPVSQPDGSGGGRVFVASEVGGRGLVLNGSAGDSGSQLRVKD